MEGLRKKRRERINQQGQKCDDFGALGVEGRRGYRKDNGDGKSKIKRKRKREYSKHSSYFYRFLGSFLEFSILGHIN